MTEQPSIQELVRRDIDYRERKGIESYGTRLYPFNGRSALLDAYEECLDMAFYLRQLIEEVSRGGTILAEHPPPEPPHFRAARSRADDETVPEYGR